MSNVLDEIRAAVQPDTVLECVENTYRPELNGSLRVVTRVRQASYEFRPLGVPEGATSWAPLPTRVRDVTRVDDGWRFPLAKRPPHTVTIRVVAEGTRTQETRRP